MGVNFGPEVGDSARSGGERTLPDHHRGRAQPFLAAGPPEVLHRSDLLSRQDGSRESALRRSQISRPMRQSRRSAASAGLPRLFRAIRTCPHSRPSSRPPWAIHRSACTTPTGVATETIWGPAVLHRRGRATARSATATIWRTLPRQHRRRLAGCRWPRRRAERRLDLPDRSSQLGDVHAQLHQLPAPVRGSRSTSRRLGGGSALRPDLQQLRAAHRIGWEADSAERYAERVSGVHDDLA